MKRKISRAFCLWIALLALFAALGLWAMADGARQHRDRPLVQDFVSGRARESAQ